MISSRWDPTPSLWLCRIDKSGCLQSVLICTGAKIPYRCALKISTIDHVDNDQLDQDETRMTVIVAVADWAHVIM